MNVPYCSVEVDDLHLWLDTVARQMDQSNDKFLYDGYEYGGNGWYFRGQSDSAWEIASSFERCIGSEYKKLANPERELRGKERKSIAEFKALSWRHVANPRMSNLEWLMLMQHHGVPTRLVDFTESASVAAYFAARDLTETPFAVWAIKKGAIQSAYEKSLIGKEVPGARSVYEKFGQRANLVINDLNVHDEDVVKMRNALANFKHCDATGVIEEEYNRQLAEQLVSSDLQVGIDNYVVGDVLAFHPECPSERMVAQRGLFMMSETLANPFMNSLMRGMGLDAALKPCKYKMSELKEKKVPLDNSCLIKYEFASKCRKQMLLLLNFANCSQASLFPDIDGVACNVRDLIRKSLQYGMRLANDSGLEIYASCTSILQRCEK